jgi:hypothetical protein
MSDNGFDELSKAAASTTSRRQALKVLGGGLLAALAGGVGVARAGDCEELGNPCTTTKDCCGGAKKDKPKTAKVETCCCNFAKDEGIICAPRLACQSLGGVCQAF